MTVQDRTRLIGRLFFYTLRVNYSRGRGGPDPERGPKSKKERCA